MDIPNGNITVFLDAVRRLADAECEKIDCETEAVRTQRLETLQQEAKARSDAYAQYEIALCRPAERHTVCLRRDDLARRGKGTRRSDRAFGG